MFSTTEHKFPSFSPQTKCSVSSPYGSFTLQGTGTGRGFYITLCTVHTVQGKGQGTIVFYRANPGPFPCPRGVCMRYKAAGPPNGL